LLTWNGPAESSSIVSREQFQLIQFLFLQTVIDLPNPAALIDQGQELRVNELFIDINIVIFWIIQQIAASRQAIKRIFPPREKPPFRSIRA